MACSIADRSKELKALLKSSKISAWSGVHPLLCFVDDALLRHALHADSELKWSQRLNGQSLVTAHQTILSQTTQGLTHGNRAHARRLLGQGNESRAAEEVPPINWNAPFTWKMSTVQLDGRRQGAKS